MTDITKFKSHFDLKESEIQMSVKAWSAENGGTLKHWQFAKAKAEIESINMFRAMTAEIERLQTIIMTDIDMQIAESARYTKYLNTACDYRDSILNDLVFVYFEIRKLSLKSSFFIGIKQKIWLAVICDYLKKYIEKNTEQYEKKIKETEQNF
jgi:hypothetical protein